MKIILISMLLVALFVVIGLLKQSIMAAVYKKLYGKEPDRYY